MWTFSQSRATDKQPIMKDATKPSIFRCIHIVFDIPIIGYIYSPFRELPNYAPVGRYVALPVIVLTGSWMGKGHCQRRFISTGSTCHTTPLRNSLTSRADC
jgi:hypothetical protein